MKRIILFSFVLALVTLTGAFANGSSEAQELADTWETVTVSGAVSFEDWPHPEITSRGTTYELMVPRLPVEELDIQAGDTVTVEGIVVDRSDSEEVYLKVIRAVVDGEEYFVPYGGRMAGPGSYCGPGEGYGRWDAPERGRFPGPRGGGRF